MLRSKKFRKIDQDAAGIHVVGTGYAPKLEGA